MDYVTNSGSENILNGLKKYMGDNEDVIMSAVNAELIELGKKATCISPWPNNGQVHG